MLQSLFAARNLLLDWAVKSVEASWIMRFGTRQIPKDAKLLSWAKAAVGFVDYMAHFGFMLKSRD